MASLSTSNHIIPQMKKKAIPLSCLQRVVPPELERVFSPMEVKKLRESFALFDTSGDGSIDKWELAKVLIALGQSPTEQDLDQVIGKRKGCMIAAVDENHDGEIQFGEFCHMMHKSKFARHESAFTATVKKAAKQMISREEIATLRYEDGSLYQGQATAYGVFQGQGTYEIGRDGNTYTGQFKSGRFHGGGHMWYSDNSVFDGEFKDGMKDGNGTMRFKDGSVFVGSLKMGLFHGYGEYKCCSGDVFKGHFDGGKKSGAGKMLFQDGGVFEGTWKNDTRAEGRGRMVWPNKDVYEGDFSKFGLYNGFGKLSRGETGDVYEGEFKDGRKHGKGDMIYANGDHYKGNWKMGTKSGQGMYMFADGNQYEGEWVNDRMKGKGTYRFASGDVYVGDFTWDHPEGQGKATYTDGSVYHGSFKEGLPSGSGTIVTPVPGASPVTWTGLWSHGKRVPGSEVVEEAEAAEEDDDEEEQSGGRDSE